MAAQPHVPAWVKDSVFYQVFPDRFSRSGRISGVALEPWEQPPTYWGYKGGDLWGLADKLGYIESLGVTALYLNPIFQSASNHRYHTHDYFRVDPLLGGNAAFERVIEEAHARNIRIVLDGVFNHASRGFFQFSDIAEHQEKSAYADWFRVRSFPIAPYDETIPATYDAWWGLHALPAFNTENPDVREFLWRVGEYWIEQGIDGWRLDVPNEIQTPGFWEEFRRRVRAINPDAYITGEIWGPAQEWVGDAERFDGVMNYKLTTAIIAYAVGNRINSDTALDNADYDVIPGLNAGEFADRIDWIHSMYAPETLGANLNLLDSHDTARIKTIASEDPELVRLSLFLLFLFPGAPCIYYGTEVGMSGGLDPDCRRGFPWDESSWDVETLALVREFVEMRHEHPGLRDPNVGRIAPEIGLTLGRSYVCSRGVGSDRLVAAINHADESDEFEIASVLLGADATLVYGDVALSIGQANKTKLTLPARSVGLWSAPQTD